MSRKLLYLLIASGIILVAVPAALLIYARQAYKTQTVVLPQSSPMTVHVMDALDLGLMTRYSVAAETACPAGCEGGIIQDDAGDIHRLAPGVRGYDPEKSALLWTYNFIPSRLTRHDDVFDSQLTVTGKVVATNMFYATPVSNQIALPLCPIEYRSENGEYL